MRKFSRRTAVLAAGVALTTGVGVAFAAWTSTGSGSGTAKSDAISNVTFSATTASGSIYPTGPAGDVTLTAANPNHYDVTLSAWSMTHAYYSTDTGHATPVEGTCDLSFLTTDEPVIDGDATAQAVNLSGSLTMGNGSVNACANKTFDVVLSATATSTP